MKVTRPCRTSGAADLTRFGRRLILIVTVAMVVVSVAARAQSPRTAEIDALTAAYLFRFFDFVTWPAEPAAVETEVRIGLVGASHLKPVFSAAEGRPAGDSRGSLVVDDLGSYSDGLDLARYRILFIGSEEGAALDRILEEVRGHPVLLVSDIDGFVDAGGMIGLRVHDRRLRWDLGLGSMREAGLDPSSQLIRAALSVTGSPAGSEGRS